MAPTNEIRISHHQAMFNAREAFKLRYNDTKKTSHSSGSTLVKCSHHVRGVTGSNSDKEDVINIFWSKLHNSVSTGRWDSSWVYF